MYAQEDQPFENYSGQKDLLTQERAIFTNENYAGFWLRVAAILIDLIVVVVASGILLSIVGIGFINTENPDALFGPILGFYGGFQVAVVLYFSLLESSKWQATLGKRAVGILVTDLAGQKIGFGRALGRYLAKFISGIILYVGFFMAGFTERKQGLHDIIAGTLVVKGSRGS
jgi:uncharacterized RDD family membrane protein YckC